MNFLCLPTLLDHFCDLGVTLLSLLAAVLFQYGCLALLSLQISLLTGVMALVPVYLVEFLPLLSLPLQFL